MPCIVCLQFCPSASSTNQWPALCGPMWVSLSPSPSLSLHVGMTLTHFVVVMMRCRACKCRSPPHAVTTTQTGTPHRPAAVFTRSSIELSRVPSMMHMHTCANNNYYGFVFFTNKKLGHKSRSLNAYCNCIYQ